jgi:hypothetical protein
MHREIRRRSGGGDSDAEVHTAWARLTLGDDLCREVWPDRALVDP